MPLFTKECSYYRGTKVLSSNNSSTLQGQSNPFDPFPESRRIFPTRYYSSIVEIQTHTYVNVPDWPATSVPPKYLAPNYFQGLAINTSPIARHGAPRGLQLLHPRRNWRLNPNPIILSSPYRSRSCRAVQCRSTRAGPAWLEGRGACGALSEGNISTSKPDCGL